MRLMLLLALATFMFAVYSDIRLTKCEIGSVASIVGLCTPGFR